MRYGYARVSSRTQDYSAQVDALKAAGCDRIFSEKKSGKSAKDRPEFNKLMRALVPGDTVVVSKLDRLARSSRDLHNILHELQDRGCGFVSLGESWCDSTSDVGRLMLTIMGGIAEFERGRSASVARTASSGPRPTASNSAVRLHSITASAGASRSVTLPARRWQSWRASTTAVKRRFGGRCNRSAVPTGSAAKSLVYNAGSTP